MRLVYLILLSVALLVSALAQSPTQPQPPSDSSPGAGEEITIDDLQGVTISSVIEEAGRSRWSGDKIIRRIHQSSRMITHIGSSGAIKWTVDVSTRIDNKSYPRRYSFSAIIDRPNTTPDMTGARAVVWTFESNTLTLLRVFEKGGRIIKITFNRVGAGFGCTATSSYLNEAGAGYPTIKTMVVGGHMEYIGVKQSSSTCRVSKN